MEARCRSGGKLRSFYGKTEREALKKEFEYQKIHRVVPSKCCLTVEKLCAEFLTYIAEKSVKLSTIENYRLKINTHIIPKLGKIPFESLTAEKLLKFMNILLLRGRCNNHSRYSALSPGYVADIMILLKQICKFAANKYNAVNPALNVELPKVKKRRLDLPNSADIKKLEIYLINNLNLTTLGVLLMMFTGIRLGELCALRWCDIDFYDNSAIIRVRKTVQRLKNNSRNSDGRKTFLNVTEPKTEKSARDVPVPPWLAEKLKYYMSEKDFYILSGTKRITEPRTLEYRFDSILKKAGIEKKKANTNSFHCHTLRHVYATNFLEHNAENFKTLQEILGHSSIAVTLDIYAHPTLKHKQQCVNSMSKPEFQPSDFAVSSRKSRCIPIKL